MRGSTKVTLLLAGCAMALAQMPLGAYAQESDENGAAESVQVEPVQVRGGEHGDYSRIVFDWEDAIPYRVSVGSGRVVVSFDEAREANTRLVNPTDLQNIDDIEQLSAEGAPLSVALTIPQGARVRDFNLGPKLVIDILDDSEQVAADEDETADSDDEIQAAEESEPVDEEPVEEVVEAEESAEEAEPLVAEAIDEDAVTSSTAEQEASTEVAQAVELAEEQVTEPEQVAEIEAAEEAVTAASEEPVADLELAEEIAETADSEAVEEAIAALPSLEDLAVDEEIEAEPSTADEAVAEDADLAEADDLTETAETLTDEPVETAEQLVEQAIAEAEAELAAEAEQAAEQVEAAEVTLPEELEEVVDEVPLAEAEAPAEPAPPAVPAGVLEPETVERVAVFDPGAPSLLSIFRRGDALWVVIASDQPLDAAALAAQGSRGFGPAEIAAADGGIALRYMVDPTLHPSIDFQGTQWVVELVPEEQANSRVVEIVPQPEFPLGPRLLVEAEGVQGLVRVADPEVGDVLVVAPMEVPAMGLARERRFVEVRLLPTSQGLVAELLADSVTMRIVRQGVEITTSDGLIMSPLGDRRASVINTLGAPIPDSFLRVGEWQGSAAQFNNHRQALQRGVTVADQDNLPRARLDLARFYFSHGYGSEAFGLLNLMRAADPGLSDRPDFRALDSAVSLIAGRTEDALDGFNYNEFNNNEEIALWRAAAHADRANWPAASRHFEDSRALVGSYPKPYEDFFYIRAGRTALAVGDLEELDALVQLMATVTDGRSDNWDITHYFRGMMALEGGDLSAAREALRQAAVSDDPKIHILARLALVEEGTARETLTDEEAVEELESLRFAWRGDEIEFDISERLGDKYWAVGRYRDAVSMWERTVQNFPDYEPAIGLQEQIPERLADLILQDPSESGLNPLRASALYGEFRETLPDGERGKQVANSVIDKLVSIDLLDRAAGLLEQQVNDHLQGEEAVSASQRQAALHLLQEKPEEAIAALDRAAEFVLPENMNRSLQVDQFLLRADALARLEKPDEALNVLAEESDRLAQAAKVNIAWKASLWPEAAEALSELVGVPPADGQEISPEQADTVVNYGIALALANDLDSLETLGQVFGPSLEQSNRSAVFKILTRGEPPLEPIRDLAAVRRQTSEIELFRDFLNGYRGSATTVAATEG